MFATFPETRWLASVMGVSPPDPDVPDSDVPVPKKAAVEPTQ